MKSPQASCVDRIDHNNHPGVDPFMVRTRMTELGLRFEDLAVYPVGEAILAVRTHGVGAIQCRATLSSARITALKKELAKTLVWNVNVSGRPGGRETEAFFAHLDDGRRCDFELTAKQWANSPYARSVDPVVDRLKRELCGGDCPEPRESAERERP